MSTARSKIAWRVIPGLVHELEQSLRLSEGLHQLRAQGYFDKAASRAGGSRIWLPLLAAAAIAGLALFLWCKRVPDPTGPDSVPRSRDPAVGPSSPRTSHLSRCGQCGLSPRPRSETQRESYAMSRVNIAVAVADDARGRIYEIAAVLSRAWPSPQRDARAGRRIDGFDGGPTTW